MSSTVAYDLVYTLSFTIANENLKQTDCDIEVVILRGCFFLFMSSGTFHLNDFVLNADNVLVPHRVEIVRANQLSVRVNHLTYYQNRN